MTLPPYKSANMLACTTNYLVKDVQAPAQSINTIDSGSNPVAYPMILSLVLADAVCRVEESGLQTHQGHEQHKLHSQNKIGSDMHRIVTTI